MTGMAAEIVRTALGLALRSGFMEPVRFGVLFRQTFGVPPSVWRRRFRTSSWPPSRVPEGDG